jgi:hypothetical protein
MKTFMHICMTQNEDVERSQDWKKKQSVALFSDGFEKLVHHWWKCVENGGDYVEK